MKCPNCGAEVGEAKFCTQCGTKMPEVPVVESTPVSEPTPATDTTPVDSTPVDTTPQYTYNSQETYSQAHDMSGAAGGASQTSGQQTQGQQTQGQQTQGQQTQYNQGQPQYNQQQFNQGQPNGAQGIPVGYQQKSKMAAGLLGIFLGAWGIHNFYLGNTTRGIIQIIVTIVTCGIGGLWGFVEGILILCGSINADANGIALKE